MQVSAMDPEIKHGNINPVYFSKEIASALGPKSVQSVTKCRDGGLLSKDFKTGVFPVGAPVDYI